MAGLPRKYAKMGFAKGWRMFKASRSRSRATVRAPVVNNMARRKRFARLRTSARRFGRRPGVRAAAFDLATIGGAMAYGASRQTLIQKVVAPIAQKLPLGGATMYADNLVLGGMAYFLAKKQGGMVGKVARSVLIIEAASAGQKLASGFLGTPGATASTSATSGATFA